MVERWAVEGIRPAIDRCRREEKRSGAPDCKMSHLKPILKGALNNVNKNVWKKIKFCLDSGAGETVMAESDLPEIPTQESWGSKHGQAYEVANGEEIKNMGEKKFVAHMESIEGRDTGGKGITAQICDVHRPLMSVKKICKAGYRIVFDDDCSYVEDKVTGETMKVIEEDGEYVIDTWVKTDDPTSGG